MEPFRAESGFRSGAAALDSARGVRFDGAMAILSNREATLTAGQDTELFKTLAGPVRLTLTGISGEFTEIPFRTKIGRVLSARFDASEVTLPRVSPLRAGRIFATTPEGVGTLDIVYEVRTRGDA